MENDRQQALLDFKAARDAVEQNPSLCEAIDEYEALSARLLALIQAGDFNDVLEMNRELQRLREVLDESPELAALKLAREKLTAFSDCEGCGGGCGGCGGCPSRGTCS